MRCCSRYWPFWFGHWSHMVWLYWAPWSSTVLLPWEMKWAGLDFQNCGQGCHFPDNMKFPDFSRPRLSSTVILRPFRGFSELGPSTWLKMNFRQQNSVTFPWLSEICGKLPDLLGKLPYFSRFSRFCRSMATLHGKLSQRFALSCHPHNDLVDGSVCGVSLILLL